MKSRLSKRLSPKAKKLALLGEEGQRVKAFVQLAPQADIDSLRDEIAGLRGLVTASMVETRSLSVEVDVDQLEKVANLKGVLYVDAGSRFRR
ncbi:MAG: hypothetical protein GY906_16620 [bacterium]|nr:hypothetical protein [bacterium]